MYVYLVPVVHVYVHTAQPMPGCIIREHKKSTSSINIIRMIPVRVLVYWRLYTGSMLYSLLSQHLQQQYELFDTWYLYWLRQSASTQPYRTRRAFEFAASHSEYTRPQHLLSAAAAAAACSFTCAVKKYRYLVPL